MWRGVQVGVVMRDQQQSDSIPEEAFENSGLPEPIPL